MSTSNLQGLYDMQASAANNVEKLMEAFARCNKEDEIAIMRELMEMHQSLAALDMEICAGEERRMMTLEFIADGARAAA